MVSLEDRLLPLLLARDPPSINRRPDHNHGDLPRRLERRLDAGEGAARQVVAVAERRGRSEVVAVAGVFDVDVVLEPGVGRHLNLVGLLGGEHRLGALALLGAGRLTGERLEEGLALWRGRRGLLWGAGGWDGARDGGRGGRSDRRRPTR